MSLLETLTSVGVTYAVFKTVDDDGYRTTTIAGLTTSLSSTEITPNNISINLTKSYVESLTDAELAALDERLSQKENLLLANAAENSAPQIGYQKSLHK